jgi:hypothetical protein
VAAVHRDSPGKCGPAGRQKKTLSLINQWRDGVSWLWKVKSDIDLIERQQFGNIDQLMAQDLTNLLFASLVDNTLDLDAFSAAVSNIYEAACKSDALSVAAVCDCLCGQGAKIIIRVLLDSGVERDVKALIISCIRQCALIERLQMDLLRAGLVDALIYTLSEGSELSSDEHHRFFPCRVVREVNLLTEAKCISYKCIQDCCLHRKSGMKLHIV